MKNNVSLFFAAETNKNYVAINTAIFKRSNGEEIVIDRDETYYTVLNGLLYMEWKSIYVWDVETQDYSITQEEADTLQFIRFEIEDDVDSDYYVKPIM